MRSMHSDCKGSEEGGDGASRPPAGRTSMPAISAHHRIDDRLYSAFEGSMIMSRSQYGSFCIYEGRGAGACGEPSAVSHTGRDGLRGRARRIHAVPLACNERRVLLRCVHVLAWSTGTLERA